MEWTRVGPRNHVLNGARSLAPFTGGGNFGGKSKSRKEESFGRRYCVMWRTSKQMRHVSSEESTCVRERATRECFYTRLGGNLSLAAAAAAAGTSLGACVRLSSATTRQLSLCRSLCGRHAWCHDALSSSCTYSALERDSGWSAPGGGVRTPRQTYEIN